MKVKIYKNELGSWIREEMVGWTIKAKVFRNRAEAKAGRCNDVPTVRQESFGDWWSVVGVKLERRAS